MYALLTIIMNLMNPTTPPAGQCDGKYRILSYFISSRHRSPITTPITTPITPIVVPRLASAPPPLPLYYQSILLVDSRLWYLTHASSNKGPHKDRTRQRFFWAVFHCIGAASVSGRRLFIEHHVTLGVYFRAASNHSFRDHICLRYFSWLHRS